MNTTGNPTGHSFTVLSRSGFVLVVMALLAASSGSAQPRPAANTGAQRPEPIPWDQFGAVAGKQDSGEGLSVSQAAAGARLHCAFQRLEGWATAEGLWLTSTVNETNRDRFRLVAVAVGRTTTSGLSGTLAPADLEVRQALPPTGRVSVSGQVAQFFRPGLDEEYSVSVDGVRQDFLVTERPAGEGDLYVELALSGAAAEPTAYGARLMLGNSGRALAYSRLHAIDAKGQSLKASLEVRSANRLAVRVADARAVYPVRIDPTFSDANWVSLEPGLPGTDYTVYAIAVDGNNIYFGGEFSFIGNVWATSVAKWDGSAWSALDTGMNGDVYALAVSGGSLYAGGLMYPLNHVARWDGSKWVTVGSGMNGAVYALTVSGSCLYAGGGFTTAGGTTAYYTARWDGSTWSALGSGMNSYVYALATSGTSLYAGGAFTTAGGATVNYIARWNGSAWSALGSGMDSYVEALAANSTWVYAGGMFSTAGGGSANHIARWNGSAWSALGTGVDDIVYALALSGSTLYTGGNFTHAGGLQANGIAVWNGAWSGLGGGVENVIRFYYPACVYALAPQGALLYVGGDFDTSGGEGMQDLGKWDGHSWSPLALGINGSVMALAVSGTDLYAGGSFTTASGNHTCGIAKWSGGKWIPVGSGMNGYVGALVVSGTNLYAGGRFSAAGGVCASNIARWDGTAWSALGSGVNSDVLALAVNGADLYAGGAFTSAGGLPANFVAKWNGTAWSALGSGMMPEPQTVVRALALSGNNLYVGGEFYSAGGVTVANIAKWNGSTWSALGSGVNAKVCVLALKGTDLYAGGLFTSAGGVAATTNLAKWNGSTWSALGQGIYSAPDSSVNALLFSGNVLYVGGLFDTAGGTAANSIARWDGSAWCDLGSGLDREVYSLACDASGRLFVGGYFMRAGTKLSPSIAQADIGLPGGQFGGLVWSPVTGFSCTFSNAMVDVPYRIQSSTSLAPGSWADVFSFTYGSPVRFTDPSAMPKRFFRAVSP